MEKIIFWFSNSNPWICSLSWGMAIMNGFNAKKTNKIEENIDDQLIQNSSSDENKLSDEIEKLNKLLKDGVLTKEEFEKAKKKILEN